MARKPRKSARVIEPETPQRATELEQWKQRVARAQQVRKDWETAQLVIEGEKFFIGIGEGGEKLKFNHFAATIKTSRPNLFFQTPKFYVRPKPGRTEPVADRKASAGEGVLEAIARQDDNLEAAGGLAMLQAFFRIGVLKNVYDPRMEPNPKAGEPMVETVNGQPVMDDETQAPKLLKHPLKGTVITEPDEVLTDETYRWAWVDAANMLLPDEGPDPMKWTWIGEEVIVPLSVAKDDTRFPKSVRATLHGNMTRQQARERMTTTSTLTDADDPMFKYYEVYDYRAKRLLIWADGQDDNDFLVHEPQPSWIDNDPYSLLPLGEPILGPDPSPWPVPPVKDWIPVQVEYELRRKQITGGAGRSARKVFYVEGTFDDEEEARKALQSPIDMEAVKLKSMADNVRPAVQADPDLNGSIYKDTAFLQADWRIITGQTGARMSDPEGGTATESSFVERAAGLRDADMQKSVTRWLAQAGRKMFQCVKETLTLELWVAYQDISDKEIQDYFQNVYKLPPEVLTMFPALKSSLRAQFGQQKWQSVTREDLIFEADVTVQPGSTRPKSLDAERRAWVEVLKIFGAAPQLLMSRKLIEYTLAKFEIEDESLVEELFMLAKQMQAVAANQAGRTQGQGAAQNGGVSDGASAVLAGATGGSR